MRKKILGIIVVGSLVLMLAAFVAVRVAHRSVSTGEQMASHNAISVSVFSVLQAHGGASVKEWPRFTQQGTLTYHPNLSAGSQGVFERKLTLSVDGSSVRYDKATLNRSQSYFFDGRTVIRTTFDATTKSDVKVIEGVEAASIRFQMATFGLLPILKRLSESGVQVVYVGATSKGNQFQVKGLNGSWYLYANSDFLIERLEVNDVNVTYSDFRTVEGLTLPFREEVRKGDKLLYEINLDTFDLNPVFAPGFFKSDLGCVTIWLSV
jgi:hypothetical protein